MTTTSAASVAAPLAELTRLLDELAVPGGPFSGERLAALDEREAFPAEACRALDAFGMPRYYVPTEHGGALDDFGMVTQLLRAVSRVDLTVAAAHGKTYLGAVSTWIAGDPARAARLGRRIGEGAVVSCALTERHHGSDLLAGEVTAHPVDGGGSWRLTGEKWLINNITRADLVTVLARTDPEGGPRGFSLFLVDKERLAPGALSPLPKVPTYGIRGADISGLAFHDAMLPSDALIGEPGQGIEIILKALHVTRTGCMGMSLGAGDHALDLAVRFTADATDDDGTPLAHIPYVRRELGEAVAGLLLAEATGVVAARSVHALTGEMSVVSAVAKAYVPAQVDDLVARLLHTLGPYGLVDADPHGRFAKLERDHRIIGIFDGSSLVNRNALIDQFPRLARAYRKGRRDDEGLAEATDVHAPLRPFRPEALSLLSGTGASVVAALPAAVDRVRDLTASGAASGRLAALAEGLRRATNGLHERMAAVRYSPRAVPGHAFGLAEQYELCFAAAATLHLWLRRPDHIDETWLRGCLVKALTELGEPVEEADRDTLDALADVLLSSPPGTVPSLLDPMEGTTR